MTKSKARANHAPRGWRTITPRIFAEDSRQLIAFIKKVFAAEGAYHAERPTVLTIGDSNIMVSEVGIRTAMSACLYVYVGDLEAVYRRAVKANAKIVEPLTLTDYGDRRCMFEDRWGNVWQAATPKPRLRARKRSVRTLG